MHNILPNLYLIDLDLPVTGFRKFISSWLYRTDELTFLVDPGPASTAEHLLKELKQAGVNHLDYILLTHIHIDHAGGTGIVAAEFPEARILCHPKGIPHLIDPQKLWAGSLKVLGKLAEAYGPIAPVPESRLFFAENIKTPTGEIKIIETPGHSAHHISLHFGELLFLGEAAGVRIPVGNHEYMRPATPPKFIYEIYRRSLEKLLPFSAKKLCFAHYGFRGSDETFFAGALGQLDFWITLLREQLRQGVTDENELMGVLLEKDANLRFFSEMPKDIRERERYFILNSIRGMSRYLRERENF